jgi:hypothetical protein
MNSLTLKEKGFSDPLPLKTLSFSSLPQNKALIIVLADSTLSGKPESDVLYIGRTKNPAKRIFAGYLCGVGGKVTRKINQRLLCDGYIEKATFSYMLTDTPKAAQKELLESFKKEHGEYPAWNASKKPQAPAKPAPKVAARAGPSRKTAKAKP